MDLKKFDSTLKSALENVEVPFDPSTWAALESRLDRLPAPDAVDDILRPSLERIETPYNAATWTALASKLDGITRVRRLRLHKLAEAAIFLLLLLNLKGFFGVVQSVTNPVPAKKEVPGPVASTEQIKSKKQPAAENMATPVNGITEKKNLTQQVLAFVQDVAASLTQSVENEGAAITANTPPPIHARTSVLDPANFYSQSGLVKFPVGPALPAHPMEPILFAGSLITIPGVEIPKAGKPSRFYAASFGSFDQNFLREGEHSDKKSGYGGGLAVGFRKGKWGIETGLQYSQKNYQPKPENETYQDDLNGVSFFSIDNVDANVFSVPVKATRRIAKLGKTQAHAVAGVTANFAASKNYGYNTVHLPPKSNSDPAAPVTPLPNGKGVLENGGLSHNAYATADLGLRVEHGLGKRYVAFVEPVFRRSLGGGLGPRSARLSTFSLQAGVMATL